jgi:hypothetical protein
MTANIGAPGPEEKGAVGADWIDGLLRAAARGEPHVEDAGFTAMVVARIPSGAPSAARRWILLGFGLLSCLLGLGVFGGAAFIWNAVLEVTSRLAFGPHQLTVLAFAALFYWYLFASVASRRSN